VYGRAAESPVPSGVAYPVDDDTGQ
jgi:hypothetical protein